MTQPASLADYLAHQPQWDADTARGYTILALQTAGYSREEIWNVLHAFKDAMHQYTPQEAREAWYSF